MQDIKLKLPEKFNNEKSKKFYLPKRFIFVFFASFGLFNVYAMRVNLSVAMVAMVNRTATSHFSPNNSAHQVVECLNLVHHEPQKNGNEGFQSDQYNWDSITQGRILGSFYYGYIITQIPGGILSEKWGFKWLIGGGIFITAVFSLITPLAANWGTLPLIIVRILEGLGEGVVYPAMNFAISTWSPKLERSRISTLVNIGSQIGNVVSLPVSGWLCSTDLFGGWPSVFYVFGGLGCIWFVLWCFLLHEKPSEHPNISKEELLHIEINKDQGFRNKSIPWKSILTSLPVWAVILACFGHSFGYNVLISNMPTYLSTILHYDIKSNGLLSALPFLIKPISSLTASIVADKLREKNIMTITNIRRVFNSIGLFGPAICLLSVTSAGCNPELIVALLTLSMILNGLVYSGFNVSYVDMSPDYSGTLFSLSNATGNLNGILAPMVVGIFTASGATIKNWSYVFYIAAAIYIVCGVIFAIFSSAELQPWGKSKDDSIIENKSEKGFNIAQNEESMTSTFDS